MNRAPIVNIKNMLAVSAALSFSGAAAFADIDYSVEAGVGHSDNLTRVATDEVDETIATAGLDLTWEETRRRLDADVTINLDYFDYLDDTYESEVVGTADANLNFGLIPQRLTWVVRDSFGQALGDPFAPVTPDNRENVNYFTTGPNLSLNVGQTGRLRLFALYSNTDYERSLLDGERKSAGLVFARSPSEASEIALNVLTERIEFDDVPASQYDRHSAFLSLERTGGRIDLSTELGYTVVKPTTGAEFDGPLVRITATREVSTASTLSMTLGTQLTDSSDALRGSIAGTGGGAIQTAAADPFENKFASLSWNFARRRTVIALGASLVQDRYETQTLFDRTSLNWDASIERKISPRLSAGLQASLINDEFDTTNMSADELRLGATLTWQMARTLGLRFAFDRYDRDSTDSAGQYVENRVFLRLVFRPRGAGP